MKEEEDKKGAEYDIVREIKRVRELKQISQKDFAEKLGEPLRTYIQFETNKNKKVSAELLFKASELLDIDIARFINPKKYTGEAEVNIVVKEKDVADLIKKVEQLTQVVEGMQKQLSTLKSLELIVQMAKQQKSLSGENKIE